MPEKTDIDFLSRIDALLPWPQLLGGIEPTLLFQSGQ